jgi:hypothetical protein
MKSLKLLCCLALLVSSYAKAQQQPAEGQLFGTAFTPGNVIPAGDVAAQVSGKDSVYLQTEGIVKEVCQQKGCWMKVDVGNGEEMLVRFKRYAFFVPKDAAGKKVVLNGKAFAYQSSVAEQRHYAEDAGKSKKEVSSIKKPQKAVRFEADGVLLF